MNKARYCLPLIALLAACLLLARPAQADAPNPLRPIVVGQGGGVASAVAYDKGYVYFNIGPRIARMMVNPAAPDKPIKPETYGAILPGVPQEMKLANGLLYVALGHGGIAIVNPTTLSMISLAELPEDVLGNGADAAAFASSVAVSARYLYAAAGASGILIYDLGMNSNSLTYLQAKTFSSPARLVTDLEYVATPGSGGTASLFVAANNNAADPAARGGVLKFDVGASPTLDTLSKVRNGIDVPAIRVGGNFVFAAATDAFYVLDTAELAIQNGSYPLGNVPVALALGPGNALAFVMSAAGIDIVSLANPVAPVGLTPTPIAMPGAALDLVALAFPGDSATYLYIADFDAGLSIGIIAAATPGTLDLTGPSYVASKAPLVRSVGAGAGMAFGSGSVPLVWAADSRRPLEMHFIGSGAAVPTTLAAMRVYNNWLIGAGGTSGLVRLAVTPGAEPTDLDSFTTGGTAVALALAWPNAIVADGANGLVIVNVEGDLALTGSAPAPDFNSSFRSVDVQGNYAYVIDANGTLRVYDLSDPTGPIALGKLALPGMLEVKVHGNFAYVACGKQGVRIINISDPNAPAFVGTNFVEMAGLAQGLELYKDNLLVAAGDAGFHMLSIQPDGQLAALSTKYLGGNTLQLQMGADGYLYAANESAGLALVQFNAYQVYLPSVRQRTSLKLYLPTIGKR